MDMESKLATNTGFHNWTKVALALSYLRDGLAGIVSSAIQSEYKAIVKSILQRCKIKEYSCCSCATQAVIPAHDKATCTRRSCNCSKGTTICPQSNACGLFYDYIIAAHQYSSPFWKNCDFQRISQNFWEFAKCFISGFGKENITCSDDTDPADMISICLHNRHLSRQFTSETVLKKAKATRNNVLHSSKMELSNNEMIDYIDTLTAVLNEKLCAYDQKAQEALNKLKKLKDETIIITTKASVCAHRAAMKAVFAETQVLLEMAEKLSTETGMPDTGECTDEHFQTGIDKEIMLNDIYMRIVDLNKVEQIHTEILEEYGSQCADIKNIIDELSSDMESLRNNISSINKTTTETQADVKLVHKDLKEIKEILENTKKLWSSCVVPIPVIRLQLRTSNIGTEKENRLFLALLDENTGNNSEELNCVRYEFKQVLDKLSSEVGENTREVTETKYECLAIYIQCWSPTSIMKLCEDCLTGLLTRMLQPVEKEVRKISGYEHVTLELCMLMKDAKKCLEILVRRLYRRCESVSHSVQRPALDYECRSIRLMELLQFFTENNQNDVQTRNTSETSETRTDVTFTKPETNTAIVVNRAPPEIEETEDNTSNKTVNQTADEADDDIHHHKMRHAGPRPLQRAVSLPIKEWSSYMDEGQLLLWKSLDEGLTSNNEQVFDCKLKDAGSSRRQRGREPERFIAASMTSAQYDIPMFPGNIGGYLKSNSQPKD